MEALRARGRQELRLQWVARARVARARNESARKKKAFRLDPCELRRGVAAAAA